MRNDTGRPPHDDDDEAINHHQQQHRTSILRPRQYGPVEEDRPRSSMMMATSPATTVTFGGESPTIRYSISFSSPASGAELMTSNENDPSPNTVRHHFLLPPMTLQEPYHRPHHEGDGRPSPRTMSESPSLSYLPGGFRLRMRPTASSSVSEGLHHNDVTMLDVTASASALPRLHEHYYQPDNWSYPKSPQRYHHNHNDDGVVYESRPDTGGHHPGGNSNWLLSTSSSSSPSPTQVQRRGRGVQTSFSTTASSSSADHQHHQHHRHNLHHHPNALRYHVYPTPSPRVFLPDL